MKTRTLGWLMLAAVVASLAGLGVYLRRAQMGRPDPRTGGNLIGFDINEVAAFRIRSGTNTLAVARKGGRWELESLYGYPADRARIAERLMDLADLKIGQVIPGGESELAEFGLDEAGASTVEFLTADGRRLARLALGKSRQGPGGGPFGGFPDGQYVRVDDGPVAVLGRNLYGFGVEPRDWIQTDLLNITPGKGDAVEVATAEGAYRLRVEEGGKYTLEGLSDTEKLDEGMARRVAGALQYLTFTTVADPAQSDEALGFTHPARYIYRKADGFVYAVTLGGAQDGGGRYARIAVAYESPVATSAEAEAKAKESAESKPGTDKTSESSSADTPPAKDAGATPAPSPEDKAKENAERAAKDHERLSRWTYVLSSWAAESMTLPRARLIQPPKPEEAQKPENGDGADKFSRPDNEDA